MATELQQKLAHRIADAGVWTYDKTIELMEKRSPFVEYLKYAAHGIPGMSYTVAGKSVSAQERAHAMARLVEELGVAKFNQAYVFYLGAVRDMEVVKYTGDIAGKFKAARESRGMSVDEIQERLAVYLLDRDAYMQARREKCTKNDPFAQEAH